MINFNRKNIIILSLILAIILILIGVVWYYFSRSAVNLISLDSQKTMTIITANNYSAKVYDQSDNSLKEITSKNETILAKFSKRPTTIIFSPDQNKAILYGNIYDLSESYRIFDFKDNLDYKLAGNIRDVVFSPDSNQMAYFRKDDENRTATIEISNFDGTGNKVLYKEEYNEADLYTISWQSDGYITALKNSKIDEPVQLQIINVNDGKLVLTEKKSFYSVANNSYDNKLLAVAYKQDQPKDIPQYSFGSVLVIDLKTGEVNSSLDSNYVYNNFTLFSSRTKKYYTFGFDGSLYKVMEIDPIKLSVKTLKEIPAGDSLKKMLFSTDGKQLILLTDQPVSIDI